MSEWFQRNARPSDGTSLGERRATAMVNARLWSGEILVISQDHEVRVAYHKLPIRPESRLVTQSFEARRGVMGVHPSLVIIDADLAIEGVPERVQIELTEIINMGVLHAVIVVEPKAREPLRPDGTCLNCGAVGGHLFHCYWRLRNNGRVVPGRDRSDLTVDDVERWFCEALLAEGTDVVARVLNRYTERRDARPEPPA